MSKTTCHDGVMFTNVIGTGDGDLLQQAFQQVVNDEVEHDHLQQQQHEEEEENNIVAYLQNSQGCDVDDNGLSTQVIQLTAEQASALGINVSMLENNATIEHNNHDCQTEFLVQECSDDQEVTQKIMNQLIQSDFLLKRKKEVVQDGAFADWNVQHQKQQQQNGHNENYEHDSTESNLVPESITTKDNSDHHTNQIEEQTSNFLHIQPNQSKKNAQKQNIPTSIEAKCYDNVLHNTIQVSVASSNNQVHNVAESQAQILQRFPVILPSSQFIIKPAQTVLTPVKNIRIFPSPTKTSSAQTSRNSLLLPKTTVLNTLSPQFIKAVPIGTQFLSTTNNISTQFLNASQLISKTNNSSSNSIIISSNNNQLVNDSLITTGISNISSMPRNLLSQVTAQRLGQKKQTQHKTNQQQYYTPVLKNNALSSNAIAVVGSASLLNTNAMKHSITKPILKSINSSMLKSSLIKNPVAISLPKGVNSSVLVTTPVIKTNESVKLRNTVSPSIIRTKISGTPVSILKPQAKAVNSSINNKNFTSLLTHKNTLSKPVEFNNGLKPLVTAKFKQTVNSLVKSMKKKPITTNIIVTEPESQNSIGKSLGSSGNTIQIIQQSDNNHSQNRLTQAQLRSITQALQQRNQNSANPKETIVYRLSFNDELDLSMLQKTNLDLNKSCKQRGRPKKSIIKTPAPQLSKPVVQEEQDKLKDDGKKIVARTRSGRLSRPPRHIIRDYKHLNHGDIVQPDLDDSDGGYSDCNANGKSVNEEDDAGQRTELLTGLEMPKRKISDDFRCPTCNKTYLGRTKMAKHFEIYPGHGSLDQLPPLAIGADLKQVNSQDPLKRKGKKRGPWAYTTPEAKSERRQQKLREAISLCENSEIVKIAAKPVVNSLSLYDLLLLKSKNNVRTFLSEIKELIEKVREKTNTILSAVGNEDNEDEVVNLNDELLCYVLGLNSGFYKINESVCTEEAETEERSDHMNINYDTDNIVEPPTKLQKTGNNYEDVKDNIEESGYSESSDLSVCDLFNEQRSDSQPTPNCPEILTSLTLAPRNIYSSPSENDILVETTNVPPKVLNSSSEIHSMDSPGFQKLSINAETKANPNFIKEGAFTRLCDTFTKFGNFDQTKMESMQRTFIKLEPTEEGFIKLENGVIGGFNEEMEDFGTIQSNGFHYVSGSISDNFNGKGFRKIVPRTMATNASSILKQENLNTVENNINHEYNESSIQITTNSSNSNGSISDATNIIESTDDLDMNYDHISHLDILSSNGIIDEKFVEPLQFINNSNVNIVDEIVSERLKSIMPDHLLESHLLQHNVSFDTDLDFEELSEEFNRNIRS